MQASAIHVSREAIVGFCQRNHIRKLALFGSVLTDRFSASSDVDVLVEFEPGARVGYLRMATMERELSELLGGRTVDLRTPNELSEYFRDQVMRIARTSMQPSDLVRLRHMLDAAREAVGFGVAESLTISNASAS